MCDIYNIYCLSYKNQERYESMKTRFKQLHIPIYFYEGVGMDDPRISPYDKHIVSSWCCMYGHLDMIYKFYHETDKEFGIFCEDDIYIHKDLSSLLPNIINEFKQLNLDVLCLGYLMTNAVTTHPSTYPFLSSCGSRNIYNYDENLWGTQMYMISRNYAKVLLDTYYHDYAVRSLTEHLTHFSADWTITKLGKRGLLYPMVAVEDGKKTYDNSGQHNFHKNVFIHNYNSHEFI